jgi:Sulfatase
MTPARWLGLAVALAVLNISLTFANIWPTLSVRPSAAFSVELAVAVLALTFAGGRSHLPSRTILRLLAAAWALLVIGRYADVTARSLYGRDINLYWDLRYVPNVGAMFAEVANPLLAVSVLAGIILVPILIYVAARWSFGRIAEAARDPWARRVMGGLATVVLALGALRLLGVPVPPAVQFARPVAPAYARELGQLGYELSGAGVRSLPPEPDMRSDFSRVAGADVFVIFLESYGAVSWERPEFAEALAPSRAEFAEAIRATGREVVSAFVESPTFGGESWLAHITLLSGTEVRDQSTNKRLLAQDRDTLVKAFGRHGYRTVAVMPGLQRGWPQGAFYGFDEIYDLARLDYRGPSFGWWDINDQFAIARVDAEEVAPAGRPPVFAFFPTITTHAPFVPTPPYQADWARLLTDEPYDQADVDQAWLDYPDWTNLGPSYVKAMAYAYETLGGYLRLRDGHDLVLVLLGDHQPPALVSGEGASWNVPVHVIASRPEILQALREEGFREGLEPTGPALSHMDGLTRALLDAFGDPAASGPGESAATDAPGPARAPQQ